MNLRICQVLRASHALTHTDLITLCDELSPLNRIHIQIRLAELFKLNQAHTARTMSEPSFNLSLSDSKISPLSSTQHCLLCKELLSHVCTLYSEKSIIRMCIVESWGRKPGKYGKMNKCKSRKGHVTKKVGGQPR